MGLNDEEAAMLKKLMAKSKEPDAPLTGRSLNISIDLGDDKQVKRAQSLGLLSMFQDDGEDEGGEGGEGGGDEGPKRRGFFGDES